MWVAIVLGLIGALSPWLFRRQNDSSVRAWPTLLALTLLIIPFAFAYVYSVLITAVMAPRYFIAFMPVGLYLLIGLALSRPPIGQVPYALLIVSLALGLVSHLIVADRFYTRYANSQYREVAAVLAQYEEGENQVLWTGKRNLRAYTYYLGDLRDDLPEMAVIAREPEDIPAIDEAVALHQPDVVWYSWAHGSRPDAILDYFEESYFVQERHEWFHAGVWIMAVSEKDSEQGD